MGREVVYCFKCQLRLIEEDFQSGKAVRVGVTTTCKKCLPELIATLPPEQKMAMLTGAPLPVTTPQIHPLKTLPDKTGQTDRLPRVHRPVQATRTHRQAPQHTSMKLIGIGAVIIAGLAALMMLGDDDPPDKNNPAVARTEPSTPAPEPVVKPPPPVKPDAGTPAKPRPDDSEAKLNRVQEALREAQAYRKANPDDLEEIAKRLKAVMWNAERTPYFETAKKEFEEVSRRIAARAAPKPPPDGQPETKPAEAEPEAVADKPESPPTPPPEPEPKPEPASVKPDPKPVVVVETPEPEPALPELWKLLMENKAKLAGKTAPVALHAPFDKSKAVIENVSDTALEMSVAFGGGRAGATKKPEEIKAEEFRELFVLAGVEITPELEKRLADLVAERERARVEAAYDAALDKAEKHMAEEDWKGAVAALNEALRLKPGDPDATRLLAETKAKLVPESLGAEADAYVRGGPTASRNFGTESTLDTKESGNHKYNRKIYIRFDLTALPASITSAKLRIYATNVGSTAGTRGVKLVADDTWQETDITWDQAPAPTGPVLGTWQPEAGRSFELDVTAAVQKELAGDRKISLLIYATSDTGQKSNASFASREAGTADQRPVLILAR